MIASSAEDFDGDAHSKRTRRAKAARVQTKPTLDRLPPHDIQMEMGVLGCCLQNPNQCVRECIEKIKDDGKHFFYDLRHQEIFETLFSLFNDRKPIDIITVQQHLKDRQILEQVGGIVYLDQIEKLVPSTGHLPYYLEKVKEKYLLRKLISTCSEMVAKVFDYEGDVDGLLSESEREILAIRHSQETGRGDTDVSSIIMEMNDNFQRVKGGEFQDGLSTGYEDLDNIAGTMKRQEMIVLAASPSCGKTTLLYNIFYNLAQREIMSGLINMDTSSQSAIFRMCCCAGQADGWKSQRGIASEEDERKMIEGSRRINQLRQFFKIRDDVNNESRLIAACRRMRHQGCKIIGIDFMQQILNKQKSKYEKVSRNAELIKELAKELDIPIIAISALNRGPEKDGRRPTMADLNGSGDIEYHANKIILLHCEDREATVRAVDLNVSKNKDGRVGSLKLTMFAPQFRFENAIEDEP